MLLVFDSIDDWQDGLAEALRDAVPSDTLRKLRNGKPRYVEDARDWLLERNRDGIIDATLAWLEANELAGFHGTRLTPPDVEAIRRYGLLPLVAAVRAERLIRSLSGHRRWKEVEPRLPEVLRELGPEWKAGKREGEVHLTLSRAGLTRSFNHYLSHGSEFDQHAARMLLGSEGTDLLASDGAPIIVRVTIPGRLAIEAAHPYFPPDDVRQRGDVPNIVKEFLEAWAFRLSHPNWQSSSLELDCGMVFYDAVPPRWIADIAAFETEQV